MPELISVLDIGTSKTAVAIALLEPERPPRIIGFASLPSKGVRKGMITNIEETMEIVAATITSAERMADVQIEDIYITVTGPNILSKNEKGTISIPGEEVTSSDVIRAIEYAKTQLSPLPSGMEILHVIPNEFIIDSQGGIKYPIGMSGEKLEVECHFIMAPTSLLKNLSKIVQRLGIVDRGFIFNAWADTFSLLTETEKELGVTLLDIGAGTTDVMIFKENKIIYSGSVPLGGNNITADIAAGLHIPSLEQAEKIKQNLETILKQNEQASKVFAKGSKKGKDTKDPKNVDTLDISFLQIPGLEKISKKLLNDIIEARLVEILEFAEKNARAGGTSILSPGGIIVTGGTAKLYNITQTIQDVTKVPVRIGTPRGLEGMTDEMNSPEFATLQGALLFAKEETSSDHATSNGFSIIDKIRQIIKSILK